MSKSYKGPLDYIDVATRIVEFRTQYPTGTLSSIDPNGELQRPFIMTAGGQDFIAYCAFAYRSPDDPKPGVGWAYEPVPGKTNFTRDSELQNAETAAWGRAMVAALAVDTRQGIASQEEVRNRQAPPAPPRRPSQDYVALAATADTVDAVRALWGKAQTAGDLGLPIADGGPTVGDYLAKVAAARAEDNPEPITEPGEPEPIASEA